MYSRHRTFKLSHPPKNLKFVRISTHKLTILKCHPLRNLNIIRAHFLIKSTQVPSTLKNYILLLILFYHLPSILYVLYIISYKLTALKCHPPTSLNIVIGSVLTNNNTRASTPKKLNNVRLLTNLLTMLGCLLTY